MWRVCSTHEEEDQDEEEEKYDECMQDFGGKARRKIYLGRLTRRSENNNTM
jgi:hypothetical protein